MQYKCPCSIVIENKGKINVTYMTKETYVTNETHIPLPIITVIEIKHFNQLLPWPCLFEIAVKVIFESSFVTPHFVLVLKNLSPDVFYPLSILSLFTTVKESNNGKITAMASFSEP